MTTQVNIDAKQVGALREKTGAGMLDCRKALVEANGDIEAAIDILRKKGTASAAKKAGRTAADGVVGVRAEKRRSPCQVSVAVIGGFTPAV